MSKVCDSNLHIMFEKAGALVAWLFSLPLGCWSAVGLRAFNALYPCLPPAQSSKSMRSKGSAKLVNDQTVQNKGTSAAATVNITFQQPIHHEGSYQDIEDDQTVIKFCVQLVHCSGQRVCVRLLTRNSTRRAPYLCYHSSLLWPIKKSLRVLLDEPPPC